MDFLCIFYVNLPWICVLWTCAVSFGLWACGALHLTSPDVLLLLCKSIILVLKLFAMLIFATSRSVSQLTDWVDKCFLLFCCSLMPYNFLGNHVVVVKELICRACCFSILILICFNLTFYFHLLSSKWFRTVSPPSVVCCLEELIRYVPQNACQEWPWCNLCMQLAHCLNFPWEQCWGCAVLTEDALESFLHVLHNSFLLIVHELVLLGWNKAYWQCSPSTRDWFS